MPVRLSCCGQTVCFQTSFAGFLDCLLFSEYRGNFSLFSSKKLVSESCYRHVNTNLIDFFNEMTGLENVGREEDVDLQ